jgi:hypothetical protein
MADQEQQQMQLVAKLVDCVGNWSSRLSERVSGTAGVPRIAADLPQHHISAALGHERS